MAEGRSFTVYSVASKKWGSMIKVQLPSLDIDSFDGFKAST